MNPKRKEICNKNQRKSCFLLKQKKVRKKHRTQPLIPAMLRNTDSESIHLKKLIPDLFSSDSENEEEENVSEGHSLAVLFSRDQKKARLENSQHSSFSSLMQENGESLANRRDKKLTTLRFRVNSNNSQMPVRHQMPMTPSMRLRRSTMVSKPVVVNRVFTPVQRRSTFFEMKNKGNNFQNFAQRAQKAQILNRDYSRKLSKFSAMKPVNISTQISSKFTFPSKNNVTRKRVKLFTKFEESDVSNEGSEEESSEEGGFFGKNKKKKFNKVLDAYCNKQDDERRVVKSMVRSKSYHGRALKLPSLDKRIGNVNKKLRRNYSLKRGKKRKKCFFPEMDVLKKMKLFEQ